MVDEPSADQAKLLGDAIDVDTVVARLLHLAHSAIDTGDQELAAYALEAASYILRLVERDD